MTTLSKESGIVADANGPTTSSVLNDGSETGLRPPYLTKFEATDEPLIVLPAFLSRADSTPQADRPRDPKNVVGHDGHPIANPDADPSALAFEPNPNLAYEKWDEYWRKIHGMRFTYEDGPEDKSMAVMLRYDQVHRVPGGPTSHFPPPYSAPVDAHGRLHSRIIGRIPAYKRPTYDGFAHAALQGIEDFSLPYRQRRGSTKIVPEEQVMFRSVPHMIAREHILIASPRHREAVSVIKVHRRNPARSREEFQKRWLHAHAALWCRK